MVVESLHPALDLVRDVLAHYYKIVTNFFYHYNIKVERPVSLVEACELNL